MPWPTWQQSGVVAILSAIAVVLLRQRPERRGNPIAVRFATELMLISALYSLWRMARKLPWSQSDGAIDRARDIVDLQNALLLPSELSLQQFVARWDWLAWLASAYYLTVHVPFLVAFLFWLFWRHLEHFSRWRNALAIVTAFCLFIRFIRVAPPRFLTDLGYVDLPAEFGMSPYGQVGTGVSPQFAAMPSIHVAWAAIVSFGIVAASTRRWRWLALAHVALTLVVVSATGHHWWLDGVVALALLVIALWLDRLGRHVLSRLTSRSCRSPGNSAAPTVGHPP